MAYTPQICESILKALATAERSETKHYNRQMAFGRKTHSELYRVYIFM